MRAANALVVVAALGACGDNIQPESDQLTAVSGDEDDTTSEDDAPAPTPVIRTFFLSEPSNCDDNSARLDGRVFNADGTLNETAICQYDFGDGTSAFGCFAVHSFPEQQTVTLTARDPATGAIASYSDVVIGPRNLTATLEVASDGLTISWDATAFYGENTVDVHIWIEPADKVVIDDPNVLSALTGTVRVTEAGTYTVTNNVTVAFGDVGGCATSAVKTIDVTCVKE